MHMVSADELVNRNIDQEEWAKIGSYYPQVARNAHLALRVYDYIKSRGLRLDSRHVIVNLVYDDLGREDIEIIPTIEAYRAIAHSSGEFAGGEVVEYGPTQSFDYNGKIINAPSYVLYSVKRIVHGQVAEWKHREYFSENVVLDLSGRPNDWWQRRPIGQLTVRAEAQCLRRAFDTIDNYTAEEVGIDPETFKGNGNRIIDGKPPGCSTSARTEYREYLGDAQVAHDAKNASEEVDVLGLIESCQSITQLDQLMTEMKRPDRIQLMVISAAYTKKKSALQRLA